MNDELEKLINKYRLKLDLKETEQKITQEEAKSIVDNFNYELEQRKINLKIKLVRAGAEIKMIKEFISELEKLENYNQYLERIRQKEEEE